jgi:transposase
MVEANTITRRFQLLTGMLDERTRRLVAAAEALSIGRGGSVAVARATGISRRAIQLGIKELLEDVDPGAGRVRRVGGGRKKTVIKDPSLRDDLERLMEPTSQGNWESPLRWTYKSVRQLTEELKQMGHQTSHRMVAELLHELGYNLKVNRKTREDKDYADLDARLEYINRTAQAHLAACDPVISVEARKKRVMGEFRNGGREQSPQDDLEKIWVRNFLVSELDQVTSNDVYNPGHDHGSVDINVDHDMETFTVESIQHWWNATGRISYAQSRRLLIATDGIDRNMFPTHLWKLEIQKLADETGLAITVCHLPPSTRKWNKIEYQFCTHIFQNWRGQPLISYAVVIKQIAPTGLKAQHHIDTNIYPSGHNESNTQLISVLPVQNTSNGEWNYTILPHKVSQRDTYFMTFS